MAQISCRISGVLPEPDEKGRKRRHGKTFGDDARAADQWAKEQGLLDPKTVWYVRIRFDRRTVSQRFATRADATRYASSKETDKQRGEIIDPRAGSIPFDTFAKDWLGSDPSKRPSSLGRDRSIVDNYLIPAFGTKTLKAIKYDDVQALVNAWTKDLAPSTVGRQFTTLRAVMSAAVRSGKIGRSPCVGIKLPEGAQPGSSPRRSLILAPEVVERLAEEVGGPLAPMVYLGAVLGLRWGEVAGLRVGDIDLDSGLLAVSHQRTRGERGEMVEGRPKSRAGVRTLALPEGLVAMLRDHTVARGLTEKQPDAYLFAGKRGAPLHYSNWRRRVWVPACEALGLAAFHFHDLRHVAGTALVASGVDVKTAGARLGHSSPTLTLRLYAQATTEADRRAADTIGAHFFPVRKNGAKIGSGAKVGGAKKGL
ncbi:MAG TPA: tyrosine-type recombinase/integrase [Acidimicrobiales bacterium]|nr:tyrosine-type recombinase/integrase [Acidimicrobiales bacterium]